MNIVLVTDRKSVKNFEETIKFENINLLGVETEIRADFVKRIAEHYNPHILVVSHGVKSKTAFADLIPELLQRCPKLRIVYCFGRVDENNERNYLDTLKLLSQYGIYDILDCAVYERGFRKRFIDILKTPMTADDLRQAVIHSEEQQTEHTNVFRQEFEKILDTTPVILSKTEVEKPYNNEEVIVIDEQPELLNKDKAEHITIGIGTITDSQAGSTLSAFELTEVLISQKQSVALFLSEKKYNNYISYHGLDSAEQGCEINGITLYPLSLYKEKSTSVKFSVCDFGTDIIQYNCEIYSYFEKSEIKICLCSFDEWDIAELAEYLNQPLPYIKEVNYVFFPVSQANFVKFSKQMIKGHCKAYRLRNSPDYTQVCDWNRNVYMEIISRYTKVEVPKKRFGLF